MTARLTPKEEQAIREFWRNKKYLAYYAHFSLLLAEIDALRKELESAQEEALEWSSEPPLTVGQYWYWGTAGKEVVQLDQYIKNESAARSGWLVWRWGYGGRFLVEDSSGARWAGPIALPPEHPP